MRIPEFKIETFMSQYEFSTRHPMCCSDCETWSVSDLLAMEEGASDALSSFRLGYTEVQGGDTLRAEIVGLYDHISPGDVLVHTGAEEAIFIFMNVALQAGDHVIVPWPCYQSLFQIAHSLGCDVTLWKLKEEDGWRPDMEALRRSIRPDTKAVVVNSPHNPTGSLLGAAEVEELRRLADEHGFLVFSDEVYRFLETDPASRPPSLCDLTDRAVSLNVMSKSFGLPGLRIGWIATRNRDLYRAMTDFKAYTTICNSGPSEFLAELALRHRDRIIGRNLDIIRQNTALLDDFFTRRRDMFRWSRPAAGPIAFPSLKDGRRADDFCLDLIDKIGVLLLPGSVYGDEYQNHFRIGFGRADLPDGLARLDDYLG